MQAVNVTEFLLCVYIPLLINVALLTLLERKLLSFAQLRVGPNKVGSHGILQPAADAVKLFLNNIITLKFSNSAVYQVSPALALGLALMMGSVIPFKSGVICYEYMFMMILMLFSLSVYPSLLAGWSSNSKYSLLGSMRAVAQTISYEISMAFFTLCIFILMGVASMHQASSLSSVSIIWMIPLIFFWWVCVMAEMHRTPFDFSEGESELVSGFNVEYSSTSFALIFMSEYAMILILSMLLSCMIYDSAVTLATIILSVLVTKSILWVRATFPRYRYDLLMELAWKTMLPWSMAAMCVSSSSILFLG